ncbi:MAG: hypothetical protein ACE5GE_16710, partial [Phycisphaerae bacterium]
LAPVAQAHDQQPPWLDEAALDNGLYVGVQRPRVIRAPGPVNIKVTLRNIAGARDLTVESVRYVFPGKVPADIHRIARIAPTRRQTFLLYKAAAADMNDHARLGDAEAVHRHTRPYRNLLQELASGALTDSLRVPAEKIPREAGSTFEMTIEVEVIEDGLRRVIRRPIEIPIQSPLPDGQAAARNWSYDVRTHTVELRDGVAPPSHRADSVVWYAGDQHLHTTYSLDAFVLDGTLEDVTDYAATAELVGLDWIIITDHSNVHVNWSGTDYYTPAQFADGTAQAVAYTAQNPLFALYGQEMGAGQTGLLSLPSHYLAYPFAGGTTGYLDNPSSGLVFGLANCEPEQVIIDRVNAAGGFGFIAHPFDSGSLAFAEWNFGNGATGWSGLEIWSDTAGQIKTTDDQALSKWHDLLNTIPAPQMGVLSNRPDFPNAFPVGLGNSDAHQPGLIGATFTYAWMPTKSRGEIVSALSEGHCVASNGPLLNGEVNGARIGEVGLLLEGDNDLDVALATTAEFGPVGDYHFTVYINGVIRATVPASGDPGFSMAIRLLGMDLSGPDKFVTLRADSFDGVFHAITNPIWLQFTGMGDGDADGRVTLTDYTSFAECMTGPGAERPPSCDLMDFNRDRDVDLEDFWGFQSAFTGP